MGRQWKCGGGITLRRRGHDHDDNRERQSNADKVAEPARMSYSEFVEPGYRYIYKVTVLDEYGIGGKDSNIVKFDHYPD